VIFRGNFSVCKEEQPRLANLSKRGIFHPPDGPADPRADHDRNRPDRCAKFGERGTIGKRGKIAVSPSRRTTMYETLTLRPSKLLWVLGLVQAIQPAAIAGGLAAGAVAVLQSPWSEKLGTWVREVQPLLEPVPPLTAGLYAGIPIAVLCLLSFTCRFFAAGYELSDRLLTISSGILWTEIRAVPLEKVTSVHVNQGPLQRLFGFGDLRIFTASSGPGEPEETLLGMRDLARIREQILARSQAAQAGSGALRTGFSDNGPTIALLREILATLRDIDGKLAHYHETAFQRSEATYSRG